MNVDTSQWCKLFGRRKRGFTVMSILLACEGAEVVVTESLVSGKTIVHRERCRLIPVFRLDQKAALDRYFAKR